MPWKKNSGRLLGLLFIGLSATGCGSSLAPKRWVAMKPPLLSQDRPAAAIPYRVGTGDLLLVKSLAGDDASRIEVSVDGTIRLPGHEPIIVDGLTCQEIEVHLEPIAPAHVEVVEYRSQQIMVGGITADKAPRAIPYQGPESIEQLLSRVRCPECQHGYRVRVVRPAEEIGGEPEIFAEEFGPNGLRSEGYSDSVRIQPGDYVYVEPDFGRKGPLTVMTDRELFNKSLNWIKQLRVAQAHQEWDSTTK